MSIRIVSLHLHPLKSGAGVAVEAADLAHSGLAGDRRWMVVDASGEGVTARSDRALLTLAATALPDDGVRLTTAAGASIDVCRPRGPGQPVTVHGRAAGRGVPADEPAQRLVASVLGRTDVRLVWCPDPRERTLNPQFARAGDHTAYADGYPLTLASAASLRQLNDWIARTAAAAGEPPGEPLPMVRFRPNVVVDGDLDPFAEDHWRTLTLGGLRVRVAKGVDRCTMTRIDPVTLASAPEPIRTLARHRQRDGKTWFAVHLIPDDVGPVRVGDPVEVHP